MILILLENEKNILSDIQEYLQMKTNCTVIDLRRDMTISFPDLEIDLYHREIRKNECIIKLTDIEFKILLYLAEQPGRVLTYEQIYEAVWKEEYINEKGIIMTHVRHIREKIELDSKTPCYIENIRGVGYRFKKQ